MEAQTPAASPTVTPSTPTTLGDASAALAMADSSLATPTPETTPASTTPAAATAQTQTETPAPDLVSTEPETKGEPPRWRWQDILANARETSAKEAEARVRQELEQQHAWAKDIDQRERDGLMTWRRAMAGDPQALAHIRANPQVVQWMKGLIEEPKATAPDPEPEPDFVLPVKDAQGNIVGERPIYSAEQQAKREAWLQRRWMADVQKEIAPLKQTAQTVQQERAELAYKAVSNDALDAIKKAHPQEFEKHRADIAAVINSDPQLMELAGDPRTVTLAIRTAWNEVRLNKVLPAQQSQTEAKVLADLQRQAVAGTASPATASATTPVTTLGNAEASLALARAQLGS
jgi:hypothetical protein